VRELLEIGDLELNVSRLIAAYRSRLAAMDTALRRELPQALFETPLGGFFFWVRLPGIDTGQLQQKALDFKVGFRLGIQFSSQEGMRDHIRLCYAFYDEEKIKEGIRRLRQSLESF